MTPATWSQSLSTSSVETAAPTFRDSCIVSSSVATMRPTGLSHEKRGSLSSICRYAPGERRPVSRSTSRRSASSSARCSSASESRTVARRLLVGSKRAVIMWWTPPRVECLNASERGGVPGDGLWAMDYARDLEFVESLCSRNQWRLLPVQPLVEPLTHQLVHDGCRSLRAQFPQRVTQPLWTIAVLEVAEVEMER